MSEFAREQAGLIAGEMQSGRPQDAMATATQDIWGLRSQGNMRQEQELRGALQAMGYGIAQQNMMSTDGQMHQYFVPYQEGGPMPSFGGCGPSVNLRLGGADLRLGAGGCAPFVAPMVEIFGRGFGRVGPEHHEERQWEHKHK